MSFVMSMITHGRVSCPSPEQIIVVSSQTPGVTAVVVRPTLRVQNPNLDPSPDPGIAEVFPIRPGLEGQSPIPQPPPENEPGVVISGPLKPGVEPGQ